MTEQRRTRQHKSPPVPTLPLVSCHVLLKHRLRCQHKRLDRGTPRAAVSPGLLRNRCFQDLAGVGEVHRRGSRDLEVVQPVRLCIFRSFSGRPEGGGVGGKEITISSREKNNCCGGLRSPVNLRRGIITVVMGRRAIHTTPPFKHTI